MRKLGLPIIGNIIENEDNIENEERERERFIIKQ